MERAHTHERKRAGGKEEEIYYRLMLKKNVASPSTMASMEMVFRRAQKRSSYFMLCVSIVSNNKNLMYTESTMYRRRP